MRKVSATILALLLVLAFQAYAQNISGSISGRVVDARFSLELDSWQGQHRVRARLRDLRPAQAEPVRLAAVG